MINVSEALLAKINNPIQLPSNQGDPRLMVLFNTGGIYIDIGKYVKSGTISSSYDDYIYNTNLTIYKSAVGGNIDNPTVPIRPGARVLVRVHFGDFTNNDQDWINIAFFVVSEIDWSDGDTFSISGTNAIGTFLKQSSMGDITKLTGTSDQIIDAIMAHIGYQVYERAIGDYEWTYTYKASDTALSAIEQLYPIFPKKGDTPGFGMLETPSGTIVIGYWEYRNTFLPVENYEFNSMSDCFSISTRRNLDKCYTKVIATGRAADSVDLEPVEVDVDNFENWVIPPSKIYFADFNGYTMQELLEDWAETVALELQHQGITDDITGPFRPQLTVGDIATFTDLNRNGVITSITHHVGMDGFGTDFSVDSGGVYSALSGWSSQMKANGYNRRQKLADTVKEIADQASSEAIARNNPVSFQYSEDEEQEPLEVKHEKNTMTFEMYGWNWQDGLLPDDSEESEEEEEEEES